MPNGKINGPVKLKRGDGNLYITLIEMGQGDCIIVSLPNGKTMMIDCGTIKRAIPTNEIIDIIYDKKYLNGYNILDALILTHPDRDHCNQLWKILEERKPEIKNAYFSFGDLENYKEGFCGHWLSKMANIRSENIQSVIINNTEKKLNKKDIPETTDPKAINVVVTRPSKKKLVKILDGTKKSSGTNQFKNCEVFLLAGDVEAYDDIEDDSDEKNRGSLVTMIVFGKEKFMFCGDATFHAEKFIKDTYEEETANLYLLQAAHHGSVKTSSSCKAYGLGSQMVKDIGFVDHVNTKFLVISAADESGDALRLPRIETTDKFLKIPNNRLLGVESHFVAGYWGDDVEFDDSVSVGSKRKISVAQDWGDVEFTKAIFSTGTTGSFDLEIEDSEV